MLSLQAFSREPFGLGTGVINRLTKCHVCRKACTPALEEERFQKSNHGDLYRSHHNTAPYISRGFEFENKNIQHTGATLQLDRKTKLQADCSHMRHNASRLKKSKLSVSAGKHCSGRVNLASAATPQATRCATTCTATAIQWRRAGDPGGERAAGVHKPTLRVIV